MARVCASGSPSLTSAVVFQTQLRSDPTLGERLISGTTVKPKIRQGHLSSDLNEKLTVVVRTDFVCLVSSHNQPDLLGLLVLQQLDITSSTLFPFARITIELEKLCPPTWTLVMGSGPFETRYSQLENRFLRLLICLHIYLLQVDKRLEVNIGRLGCLLLCV